MRRILVFVALAIVGVLALGAPFGRAEIWTGLKGDAAEYATYICAPCCRVTNTHGTQRVRIRLFEPIGHRDWVLEPAESVILTTMRGACIKAALGMEADFVP